MPEAVDMRSAVVDTLSRVVDSTADTGVATTVVVIIEAAVIGGDVGAGAQACILD